MNKAVLKAVKFINNFKYFWGKMRNFLPFKIKKVKCEKMPNIRGKIYIKNYGKIEISRGVTINSNLESSQLGFYPKTILHTGKQGKIFIGEGSGMSNVCLYSKNEISIGKNVMLGAGVKIYDNDFHELNVGKENQSGKIPSLPVKICDNVFVGAGSIVLKGVTIGVGSVIGAGSVVAKSIPDGEVWAGNPAKFIRKIGD